MPPFVPGEKPIKLDYADYAAFAQDGDLLLWTPRSFYGQAIANYTGGPYCHCTAVAIWNTRPMSVGYDERRGGVAMPLMAQVLQNPGSIHVYRVNGLKESDRIALVSAMLESIGWRYRWGSIRLLTLTYLPILRCLTWGKWFAKLVRKASQSTREGICSQFIAREFAARGFRFIHKEFAITTPNDIGLSGIVEYVGTLVPGAEAKAVAYEKSSKNKQTVSEGTIVKKLVEYAVSPWVDNSPYRGIVELVAYVAIMASPGLVGLALSLLTYLLTTH